MSTSETVGQTVISTAKVLEHALRRCGVQASQQIPETVYTASECLYLLLMHYANRGLNLWCIEKKLLGYRSGKKNYALPVGTNDVLDILHAHPNLVQASPSSAIANVQQLPGVSGICRIGVKFVSFPTSDFTISASADGVSYTHALSVKYLSLIDVESIQWFDLDPKVSCEYISVSSGVVDRIYAATSVTEIIVQPLNRDTYASLPNKDISSTVVTNTLFNKTLNPTLTVWPVPSDETRHLTLWVHRQIQDVGSLTQSLAIPQRWFETTIVQLAARLSLELPGIDPARISTLQQLADKFQFEAYSEETDSAPINLSPHISPYTR